MNLEQSEHVCQLKFSYKRFEWNWNKRFDINLCKYRRQNPLIYLFVIPDKDDSDPHDYRNNFLPDDLYRGQDLLCEEFIIFSKRSYSKH